MEHTSKQTIEESRLRNQELYKSLLRLESLLDDVRSGKTYQNIYIFSNYDENMLLTLRLYDLVVSLTIKKLTILPQIHVNAFFNYSN